MAKPRKQTLEKIETTSNETPVAPAVNNAHGEDRCVAENNLLRNKVVQLEESYKQKCHEYEQLLLAYKALAIRFNEAGNNARALIRAAQIGINATFPVDTKEN